MKRIKWVAICCLILICIVHVALAQNDTFKLSLEKNNVYREPINIEQKNIFISRKYGREDYTVDSIIDDNIIFNNCIIFSQSNFIGLANFKNAHFKKNINFSWNNFSNADFSQDVFNDSANFNNSKFDSSTNYANAVFRNATFIGTTFNQADFSKARFSNYIDFSQAIFYDKLFFENVIIQCKSDFSTTNYQKDVSFSSTLFSKSTYFKDAKFQGNSSFSNASFLNDSYFDDAEFQQQTSFAYSTIQGNMDFSRASFKKSIDFKSIIITDQTRINFDHAYLPDIIDFSGNNKLPIDIDLLVANFDDINRIDTLTGNYKEGKWHYINLYKSDVSKFHLDYFHFKLLLINPNDNRDLSVDESKSVYEGLLKNFKDRGQMDSYELLDIEYHDYIWHNSYFSWFGIVPHYWNFYGHKKGFIFLWTAILLLIFTMITFFKLNSLNDKYWGVYHIERVPDLPRFGEIVVTKPLKYYTDRAGIKLYYLPAINIITKVYPSEITRRFWYSFIYTSCIFFLITLKMENMRFSKVRDTVYIIIVYSFGLLCLGYMANFILQK